MANGQCKKSLLTPIGEVEFENFDKAKNAICTDDNEECCDSRIIIKESISSECNIENGYDCRHAHGGFQLEFVSISLPEWKIYLKRYPLQDLLSSLTAVISTNERH